jgi:hypothetical protein
MIKIPLTDIRIGAALKELRELHNIHPQETIAHLFEEQYKCKLMHDTSDPWALSGWVEMSEQYYTWFSIKFGDASE